MPWILPISFSFCCIPGWPLCKVRKKKNKSIFTLPRVVTLMECYLWGNIHCGLDYLKLSGWNDMEKTLYLALCEERGGGEREVIYTVKTDVSRGRNICWV